MVYYNKEDLTNYSRHLGLNKLKGPRFKKVKNDLIQFQILKYIILVIIFEAFYPSFEPLLASIFLPELHCTFFACGTINPSSTVNQKEELSHPLSNRQEFTNES